jgi:Retroviral aspartyl protease
MPDSINVGYRSLPDQILRPYLIVDVTGPNGNTKRILGIVDSGADSCCFPVGLIPEFGYDMNDLTEKSMGQAGGTTKCWEAKVASTACVPDFPALSFPIMPTFLDGQFVLWGRSGFMSTFDVQFFQLQNRFVLTTH